jgi:hypothetical protein
VTKSNLLTRAASRSQLRKFRQNPGRKPCKSVRKVPKVPRYGADAALRVHAETASRRLDLNDRKKEKALDELLNDLKERRRP